MKKPKPPVRSPVMRVGTKAFKDFIRMWLSLLREIETEALVYRQAIEVLRPSDPAWMDSLLKKARENPKMVKILDEKYERHLKTMLEQVDKGSAGQALSQFLRDWKPEGPTN
jgi:hypothetical protein